MRKFIGLDLGGTSVKAGVVDDNGVVLSRLQQKVGDDASQRTSASVVALLAECSHKVVAMAQLKMSDISGIGIGSPGILDTDRGIVIAAANFKDWNNVHLTKLLSEALSLPVKLENDANAALLAEAWIGAAKGKTNVVMITLGTGIGGGLLIDGRILRGMGMAGEVGHQLLVDGGRECGCGQRGCFETYASGRGVARSAAESKELNAQFPGTKLDATQVFALATRERNTSAQIIIHQWAGYMATGLLNIARIVDPHVIILGGGVALNDGVVPMVTEAFLQRAWRFEAGKPAIRLAQVGNDAGLIGAAYVGRLYVESTRARM
jgi:glucokinase